MKRRIAVGLSLVVTWACYGLVMLSFADNEASRCHQFGDLAAECTAPFMLFFAAVSIAFVIATLVLKIFALRSHSEPDSN